MNASWLKYLPPFITQRLTGRYRLQAILGNSGWLFADRALRMGIGVFVSIWVARYLGPERFGQFNFAVAFVTLFGAITTLGLDGIVVRELVRYPDKKHEILGSAFGLKIIGGFLAFLIVLVAIVLLRPLETQTQWLVGIIAAGMIFQAFDIADLWFQSQVQSKFTVIAKNMAFVVMAAVKVWLILTKADLMAFALIATAETVLGALGLVIAFQSTGNSWCHVRPVFTRMVSLLRESWPLLLSGLAVTLYMRIDQVMLAEMAGDKEVGLYSAALRLSEVWYVIPTILVSSAMPYLTEAHAKSEANYYKRLQQLFTSLVRLAYLVSIMTTFLAIPMVQSLYGTAYSQTSVILAVHIWAGVFVFLGVATSPWIVNEGVTRIALYQTVLGAISNVVLNIYLIPSYGALGCAIATTVSYGLSAWILNGFFIKTNKIFIMQTKAMLLGFRT